MASPFFFLKKTPLFLLKQGWGKIFRDGRVADRIAQRKRLLELARRGALGVRLDITRPEWLAKELDRVVNRLSVSLITSSLIVGSSIVSTVEGGAHPLSG
ncbi:MAG: hypothetical protein H0A75_07535 [Candidatus Methanofishera endochildressiae]|uniref:Uncharacterized protein n=1 Tax=Candidatus Methanofishera endochildressiae TaxID=2738884 RepID=A0A7Z0MQ17_9GAMM|nr:hypothetical protein [Candidatus Methanofishera endochildressiae]